MREELNLLQVDPQKVPEVIITTIKELQDSEIEEYLRLDTVKRAILDRQPISKYEINHLISMYKKLQEAEYQKKVQWTLDVIKKLQQAKIGDLDSLDSIKNRLEEGITLEPEEVNYLKENWKVLRKKNNKII